VGRRRRCDRNSGGAGADRRFFTTRGARALSFVLFTATLFGLPDDPVPAHVALFGMASAVFTLGSAPLSFDRLVGRPA